MSCNLRLISLGACDMANKGDPVPKVCTAGLYAAVQTMSVEVWCMCHVQTALCLEEDMYRAS